VTYAFLAAVLILTSYGHLIVKARSVVHIKTDGTYHRLDYLLAMFTDLYVLTGIVATVLAAGLWMLILERTKLSYAYPFMAMTFVLVPLGSAFFFGEKLPPLQILGIGLIVVGVAVSALAR
jgi:drug/metabolite transporter (DMT)-like permease